MGAEEEESGMHKMSAMKITKQNKSNQFIIIKQSRTKHMTQHLQRHGPLHLLM